MNSLSAPLPESPELAQYQIYSRSEIASLLREVQQSHVLLTISFNAGTQFIVTSMLAVNPGHEELVFDCGANDAVNRSLTRANRFTIVTFLNHVKIQFSGPRMELTSFENRPALRMRMPESVLRFQRREYFRTATLGKPAICHIPPINTAEGEIRARVLDIGCGGISLLVTNERARYEVKTLLPGCRIELPGIGNVSATLETRDIAEISTSTGLRHYRYGCAFRGMPGSMSALIQRYVNKLQRDRLTLV